MKWFNCKWPISPARHLSRLFSEFLGIHRCAGTFINFTFSELAVNRYWVESNLGEESIKGLVIYHHQANFRSAQNQKYHKSNRFLYFMKNRINNFSSDTLVQLCFGILCGLRAVEKWNFQHESNLRQKHRFDALWLSEWGFDGPGLFDMCKTATIYQLTPLPRFSHYSFQSAPSNTFGTFHASSRHFLLASSIKVSLCSEHFNCFHFPSINE